MSILKAGREVRVGRIEGQAGLERFHSFGVIALGIVGVSVSAIGKCGERSAGRTRGMTKDAPESRVRFYETGVDFEGFVRVLDRVVVVL